MAECDFNHYLRVANKFEYGTDEWLVGLLHDAIEDGLCHPGYIPVHIRSFIRFLTRNPHQSYDDYILNITRSALATKVKIADLEDNLARMDAEHESLRPRYAKALNFLRGPYE